MAALSQLNATAGNTFGRNFSDAILTFSELLYIVLILQIKTRLSVDQTPEPRRRPNIVAKAERRKRIFARLREGWAYDEIAREERLSDERTRQIVSEVLGKRVIDRGADHAHLQLERLMPALRVVGEAIGRGGAQGGGSAHQADRPARQASEHRRRETFLWTGGAAAAYRQEIKEDARKLHDEKRQGRRFRLDRLCKAIHVRWSLRGDDAMLGQVAAERIDQLRALANQEITGAKQHGARLLVLGLDRHGAHEAGVFG